MIRFFSSGYLSRYLLLVFLGLVIWIPSLLFPNSYTGISSYAFDQISYLTNHNIYIQTSISFVLTLVTAFLLNQIAINNGLIGKVSTIVALFYILLTSSLVGEFHNNPAIWINFILIFVLGSLMRLPYVSNAIPVVFNASFLLGLASLFYTQLVFLIVFIWVSIIIHRIVTWRNFAVSLIGIVLPYFFLLTWFFWRDSLLEESYVLFDSLQIDIAPIFLSDPIEIVISVILLFITIISTFGIAGRLTEKNINLRRNLIITMLYVVTAFLVLLVFSKSLVSTLLLSIPSALIMGHWLSNLNRIRWYNIVLSLVMVLVILNQYLNLLFSL